MNVTQILLFAVSVVMLQLTSGMSYSMCFGIFTSILIHELGHAYFTMKCGGRVNSIYILPMIGGICNADQVTKTRWNNCKILLGGPLFGLLSGIFVYIVAYFTKSAECMKLASNIAFINMLNLLPLASIMDGGQILSTLFSCFHRNVYKFGQYICFISLIFMIYFLNVGIVFAFFIIYMSLENLKHVPDFEEGATSPTKTVIKCLFYYVLLFISCVILLMRAKI